MHRRVTLAVALFAVAVATAVAQQTPPTGLQGSQPQQPARDTPAQATPPPPAGRITGRVLASDNGRPVKRARVSISAAELPGGRGALTDDTGVFDFMELPAGRYTMTVSKAGFVSLSYGQRRPLMAGTPLQLADGQQLKGIEFRLPRGSVISGHVYDEDGDVMPGVMVRVMRYEYAQGDKRLVAAGTGQTDDKGLYRVWGLMPGSYYVTAQARINMGGAFGRGGGRAAPGGRGGPPQVTGQGARGGGAGGFGAIIGQLGGRNLAALFTPDDLDEKEYAATYFPGVTSVNDAQAIVLGLSEESLDKDFSLQLVHVWSVGGHVTDPDGSTTWSGNVTLLPDAALERGGQFGMNYGSRINWDGTFEISNVPPGRYVLRARGDDGEQPQFASQPLTVGDQDLTSLSVILSPGASISGTLVFPTAQSQLPDPNNMRITATSTEQQVGNQPQVRVQKDYTFSIEGIPTGPHLIRPNGNLRGWSLKSVVADGRDITDIPMDLRGGQVLSHVVITFTNTLTEINGTIVNDQKVPVTDYTVLAFSTDSNFWKPQSRHIMTTRTDQTGQFKIRGLPAGDYYITLVDPAEQGEWFEAAYLEEHRIGAGHVGLGDGDTKTYDFKVRAQ